MKKSAKKTLNRRDFLIRSSAATAGIFMVPYMNFGKPLTAVPLTRDFGKCNFEVTTLGLGGQASLQWTPDDVDPVRIILKAFNTGINYYDTSNLYGPSQVNFGKAFRELKLIPGSGSYDEKLRRSVFLTSKTHMRWAKGGDMQKEGVNNWTNGDLSGGAVGDLKRSLSQMFGDGQGNYPEGAYIDMMLAHNLNTLQEVDALYEGLDQTDPQAAYIGAFAALRDYRDGTNRTGLNPKGEKLIRHIGFSGHFSPLVMTEMIQRDKDNILDGMLVAINANDRLNFNMQYNVIQVAKAKNMGIIAMKVFADGAMYTKPAEWSREPKHVVRTVGSISVPSRPLIEYSLTTPGISTAIIGIGQVDEDPDRCQLKQNYMAAQLENGNLTETDRRAIEKITASVKDGKTNYFQDKKMDLSAPRNVEVEQTLEGNKRAVRVKWNMAYAGDEPVKAYEVWRDDRKIGTQPHQPQTTKKPFEFADTVEDQGSHLYKVVAIDYSDREEPSEKVLLSSAG